MSRNLILEILEQLSYEKIVIKKNSKFIKSIQAKKKRFLMQYYKKSPKLLKL